MRHPNRFLLSAIAITLLLFGLNGNSPALQSYPTRNSEGDVSFALTPQAPAKGRFTVNVGADTHSGDLAEVDLRRVMVLHAAGKTYRPVTASTFSGHHGSGSVAFELEQVPTSFFITITGVRNMGELKFAWP